MRLHFLNRIFTILGLCWGIFLSAQYTIPEKPNILHPVYDEVGLLSKEEKLRLNEKLIKFEDSTSTEIEVIIIPSTKGEDINFLATKFGQQWGIGKKKVDNGVVFLIATEDRKMSIQQGRAVEQYLTASVAGQILDYLVAPNFKQGNWYRGIDEGTNAIMEALQGKFKPKQRDKEFPLGLVVFIIIGFVVVIIIASKNQNNGGTGGGYNSFDDDVIITRRGRRNYPGGFLSFPGFGGGSSGGGFGGFGGGGSFGGGGASGGW
ncbi:MAG: TPM domain-containing protein [Flavobacteriaceae bacterium]|nr:TPM domain-containing protein [Flavobacteriaceae bacterium]